ncbi:MAG: DUF3365 domain-containing protein, partial [Candidatus Hydrogenedentes bacterium]|nr:DUF3365 domain-containing protein [Candidatus Hydrogenedentota bacterium]
MKIHLRLYVLGLVLAWTALVSVLLLMDVINEQQNAADLALVEARTHVEEYAVFLAPAFMTRETHQLARDVLGTLGQITSLTPTNPENAPDPWEADALRAFESGDAEASSIEEKGGEGHLRYMAPLILEEQCMACHSDQGREVGQIFGGVSVSVPLAPYLAIVGANERASIIRYGALWAVGLLGLAIGARDLTRRVAAVERMEESLRASESRLSAITDSAQDAILTMDPKGLVSFWNPAAERILGYTREEAMGRNLHEFMVPERYREAHYAAYPEFLRT